jgi:hypothetical protein
MLNTSREGFIVRVLSTGRSTPAGVGLVVTDRHIVTAAHVVNTALGRDAREQESPGPDVRIQVDFPMLGNPEGAPTRYCRVEAWTPPPISGVSGGDVAGLVLIGESLPEKAGSARLTDPLLFRDAKVDVFGYPGDPPRQQGAWAALRLLGPVGGGAIQLVSDSNVGIRAQPGFSGAPVVVTDGAGDAVVGMLTVTSTQGDARDAYAIPASQLVDAWPKVLGNLVNPASQSALTEAQEEDDTKTDRSADLDEVRYAREPVGRDFYTLTDAAGHAAYADAVARAIQHKDTQPPLTIGIKGAWGSGKTSLMRMVQDRLEWPTGRAPDDEELKLRWIKLKPEARSLAFLGRLRHASELPRVRNWTILRHLRALSKSRQDDPPRIEADPKRIPIEDEHADLDVSGWRPTVWFNPWMYQTGEQVWAGLAYEIIQQITGRMSIAERENFWLRLNLKRVDEHAVRRKIYRLVIDRLIPFAVAAIVLVICGLTLAAFHVLHRLAIVLTVGGPALFAVAGAGQIVNVLRARVSGSISQLVQPMEAARSHTAEVIRGSYDDLVRSPDYESKSGFFYLVRADVQRVLDLVATEERPVVVFVDDLDRCSPGTVVQVIEAINLFLAGEYPNSIFVIAMEPEMVAAHVEAAYSEVVEKLSDVGTASDQVVDLGWRFLEKIVQLPLTLPAIEASTKVSYFESLFQEAGVRILISESADAELGYRQRRMPGTPLNEAEQQSSIAPQYGQVEAIRKVIDKRLSIESPEVAAVVALAAPFLAGNPREMKRFVNLFRFLVMIDSERALRNFPSLRDLNSIAKLAILHIRWPSLIAVLGRQTSEPNDPTIYELLKSSGSPGNPNALRDALGRAGLSNQVIERLLAKDLREFLNVSPAGEAVRCYL